MDSEASCQVIFQNGTLRKSGGQSGRAHGFPYPWNIVWLENEGNTGAKYFLKPVFKEGQYLAKCKVKPDPNICFKHLLPNMERFFFSKEQWKVISLFLPKWASLQLSCMTDRRRERPSKQCSLLKSEMGVRSLGCCILDKGPQNHSEVRSCRSDISNEIKPNFYNLVIFVTIVNIIFGFICISSQMLKSGFREDIF